MVSAISLILGFGSYAFVVLAVFRLFRVNYFNPIVKAFATYLEPVSKSLFFFLPPLFAAIAFALVLKFSSFYLAYSSGYEPLTLLYISTVDVFNSGFRILFYFLDFLLDFDFFIFFCSISACAAATMAIGILCGDALTYETSAE